MRCSEFVDLCLELLAPASATGAVWARAMFGGHGLYVDDLFVALIAADRLYLKTDATIRPQFAAAGGEPFVFDTKTGPTATSYWSLPAEALESPALMLPWARLAIQAALKAAKPVKRAPAAAKRAKRARR